MIMEKNIKKTLKITLKKKKKVQLLGREPTSLELIGHRGIYATDTDGYNDKIIVYITSRKLGIKYRLFPSLFAQ